MSLCITNNSDELSSLRTFEFWFHIKAVQTQFYLGVCGQEGSRNSGTQVSMIALSGPQPCSPASQGESQREYQRDFVARFIEQITYRENKLLWSKAMD